MSSEQKLQVEQPLMPESGVYDNTVIYKNDVWRYLGETDYNPQDISFSTFRKMKSEDAQVNAALRILVLATLARGFELNYSGNNPEQGAEMIRYFNKVFENVNTTQWKQGGLYQVTEEITEIALSYGFAVSEMVYDMIDFEGKKMVGLKKLKTVPPCTVENGMLWDKFGNLEKVQQTVGGETNCLDLDRLLIWSYRMEGANWYGQSDLRQIYKNWYIKDFVTKMWNIAIERYGSPLLVGAVRNKKDLDNMTQLLESVRTKTNLAIVKGDEVDAIETKPVGENFENAIRYHDTKIMVGLLVPTLLLSQEDVGARALGDTHMEIFLMRIRSIQNELVIVLHQLIRILTDFNFKDVDSYVEIVPRELSTIDKVNMAKMLEMLIASEVISPDEAWIRKHMGLPESHAPGEAPEVKEPVDGEDVPESELNLGNPTELAEPTWPEDVEDLEKELLSQERKLARPLRSYISNIDSTIMPLIPEFMETGKVEIPDPTPQMVEKFVGVMNQTYHDGYDSGKEIIESLKKTQAKRRLQDAPGWFNDRGIYVFTKLNEITLAELQGSLDEALANGFTPAEIEAEWGNILDGVESSPNKIQAMVRTNINAAFNRSRIDLYRANSDFVKGVQYSAIMDSRTTPFCDEHHGMIMRLDDPRLEDITPPNHVNCRSYLVAATVIDEPIKYDWIDGETSPEPGFGSEAINEGDISG